MTTPLHDRFSTYSTDHLLSIRKDDLEPEVRETIDVILESRGVTPDQIVVDLTEKEPSTGKYIGAWILWSIVGNLLGLPIVFAAGQLGENIETMNQFIAYMAIVPVVEMAATYLAFVIVYRGIVTSLKVSVVVPWVYVLGTLGAIAGVGKELAGDLSDLQEMPQVLNTMIASYVISWIVVCLLIRQLGIRQDRADREKRARLEPSFSQPSAEAHSAP